MGKSVIHTFDPVIYPARIWVSVNPSSDDICSKFYGLTSELEKVEFTDEMFYPNRFVTARTTTVCNKEDGWIGLLVSVYKKKYCTARDIAHESVHCADFIFENFGLTKGGFDDGESYAYLVGWIAACIESVLKNKQPTTRAESRVENT